MTQVLRNWSSVGPKDEFKFAKRSPLRRKQHVWDVPVAFTFEEQQPLINSEKIVPVIPNIRVGGKPELIPFELQGMINNYEEARTNPDAVVDEHGSYIPTASEAPWNQSLLTSDHAKSLYRISLTHDIGEKEFVAPRGLYNTRNMCFFNSVLQVLIHCAPLNALFKKIMTNTPLYSSDPNHPVLNALIKFFYNYAEFGPESRRAISGDDLYDVICYHPSFHVERDRQEDSQEFLSDLLDVLETNFRKAKPTEEDLQDDLLGAKRQATAKAAVDDGWTEIGHKSKAVETQHAGHQDLDNPIEGLFGGRFKSVLVKSGGKPSVTTEPFQQVPVDISAPEINSVQQAFDAIFADEQLTLDSAPATKHLELNQLPPILIVNLKRFTFIRRGDSYDFGKITKPITVGQTLKLHCNGLGLASYTPAGVIYHHGTSTTSGHYTAEVRVRDQWYRIDDEQVVPVHGHEVMGRDESGSGGSRSAYMIFYEKLN